VLLIRELAVRKHLSTAGIIVAGFAYGSYNEGLWAKTMIATSNVPLPAFNDYGDFLGIAIPWALLISFWHALGSVFFPIVLTHTIFPGERQRSWLDWRLAIGLAAVLLAFGVFAFLQPFKQQGTIPQLCVFLSVIAGGTLVASYLRSTDRPMVKPAGVLPVLLGASVAVPFIALIRLGQVKAPVAVFILALILVIAVYAAVMRTRSWQEGPNLTLFALGFYIQTVFIAMVLSRLMMRGALVEVVSGAVLIFGFTWAAARIQTRLVRVLERAD